MTDLFLITASAAVFFGLQAIYWLRFSRKQASDTFIVDRLGGEGAVIENSLLLRDEAKQGRLSNLSLLLEEAGEDAMVSAFIARMGIWALLAFAVGLLVFGSVVPALLVGGGAAYVPLVLVRLRRRRRYEAINRQLPDALEVMIISLRAGYAFPKALRSTAAEVETPLKEELLRVADEISLGRTTEDALVGMGTRLMEVTTVRTFVVAVLVLMQTGGNLVEVLDRIIDGMHEQTQYARKLAAMTAEGRLSARILGGLPPAFILLAYIVGPDYVGQLFEPGIGLAVFAVSCFLYATGLFWVKRLVDPGL